MSRFGLVAFLKARLDKGEADARARRGIFPSPAVEDNGAVWLHVQYGGNVAVVHYRHPAEGYGDMAALKAWADTDQGWTQDRALREIAAKRSRLALLDEAITEVDRLLADDDAAKIDQGVAIGRAEAARTAVELDAAIWSDHPDYRAEWKPRA